MYTITIHDTVYRNQSALAAADILLSHDGQGFALVYDYKIRRDKDGGHCLLVSQFSRNSTCGEGGLTRSVIWSHKDDLALASRDIALKVIQSGFWETDYITVWTDLEYDGMLAEDAAENEEV